MELQYVQAYPGTQAFDTASSAMVGPAGLNATYWATVDWSGAVNRTLQVMNITADGYPADLGSVWPEVSSLRYEGHFTPNETELY